MNKRQIKRDACFRAALALRGVVDGGWLLDEDLRLQAAMQELIAELERRGWKEAPKP